jgi:hypothetical protein
MLLRSFAALAALAAASSLAGQTVDLKVAAALQGNWTYSTTSEGSQAAFANASALPQLTLHCVRATRHVRISKPAAGPVSSLTVWTSEMSRSLPAGFDAASGRINSQLAAYDSLLDALALSRARIAVTVAGAPPLVLPSSPEITRVVEDCRA